MTKSFDIAVAALAFAGVLAGSACGGSGSGTSGAAASSSAGASSGGLVFGGSSGGHTSGSSGGEGTSVGGSSTAAASATAGTNGATAAMSSAASNSGGSTLAGSSSTGGSSGAASTGGGTTTGGGSSSGGSTGSLCGQLTVSCSSGTYYCPPNAVCGGGNSCSCPSSGYLAVDCDGTPCGGSCVAPNWWCGPLQAGSCGALNFVVGCSTDAGTTYDCPANSSCVGGGCTCNVGYTADSCDAGPCSDCSYPNWWCAPG